MLLNFFFLIITQTESTQRRVKVKVGGGRCALPGGEEGSTKGAWSQKQVGNPESKDHGQVPLWGSGWSTQAKGRRGFHWCV